MQIIFFNYFFSQHAQWFVDMICWVFVTMSCLDTDSWYEIADVKFYTFGLLS